MDEKMRQEIALHRWAVIAEAANMDFVEDLCIAVARALSQVTKLAPEA